MKRSFEDDFEGSEDKDFKKRPSIPHDYNTSTQTTNMYHGSYAPRYVTVPPISSDENSKSPAVITQYGYPPQQQPHFQQQQQQQQNPQQQQQQHALPPHRYSLSLSQPSLPPQQQQQQVKHMQPGQQQPPSPHQVTQNFIDHSKI